MERILIHYFSGTGNSLHAAKLLSQELIKHGYDVVFHAVEDGSYDSTEAFALHIFFFPIYATSVPHIMRRYIRKLPNGKNARAVVISTNGKISTRFRDGYQGWALHQARIYLSLKNYNVFLSETLDYPHNITVAIPPRKEEYNQKMIEQASEKLPNIAKKIVSGQKSHRAFFPLNIIWSLPFGILYSIFGRRFMGKLFVADSSCSSCKLCAEKCPAKAITIKGKKVRWSWNCEGCMRCINNCPKHAIQTSAIRISAFIGASLLNPFVLIHSFVPAWFYKGIGNIGSIVFDTLAYVVFFAAIFVLLDWLFYKLSYIPFFNKIINWGYTRFYGRYCADKFINKD